MSCKLQTHEVQVLFDEARYIWYTDLLADGTVQLTCVHFSDLVLEGWVQLQFENQITLIGE